MVLLMKSDVEAERYIVSEGSHAYLEVFTHMANALGKKPPRYHASAFMTGIIWRLSLLRSKITGKESSITRETANNAHSYSYYNNEKLLAAFPQFYYTPIKECIARMAGAFNGTA